MAHPSVPPPGLAAARPRAGATGRLAILVGDDPHDWPGVAARVLGVLHALRDAGFDTGTIPDAGDDLARCLAARCHNGGEALTESQLCEAPGRVSLATYDDWFNGLPAADRRAMVAAWGLPLGGVGRVYDCLAVPGLVFGRVFLGVRPSRDADPARPPSHHDFASFRWLRDEFRAGAVWHAGGPGVGPARWASATGAALARRVR